MGELTSRTNRTNSSVVRFVRTTHTTPFRGVCFVREFVCEDFLWNGLARNAQKREAK
jgi:hypothetical protein